MSPRGGGKSSNSSRRCFMSSDEMGEVALSVAIMLSLEIVEAAFDDVIIFVYYET